MKKPVSIVLAGIGGMGSVYLSSLLENRPTQSFRLKGAADPFPQRCPHLDELRALNVPIFESLEEFYSQHRADLAIISSPIYVHCFHTCLALSHGSYVLCEKPAAATIQEVKQMIEAEKRARRWVAIGYQWSFSTAIQNLKKDILKGLFGRPKRLRCLYLWPRDKSYYCRNDWAGKQKDEAGRWILDSPANNAMAHDLHNMFYVLGKKRETSALPQQVEAELYRAYDIPNFDTAALRCFVEEEAEILFYVSHAAAIDTGPIFSYEFEKGIITASGRNSEILAHLSNGSTKNYGSPDSEPLKKMWEAINLAGSARLPACGLEAAVSQTLCLNGAQDSMPQIQNFPRRLLVEQGEPSKRAISVIGLDKVLKECYDKSLLPSELGVSWSKKGRVIDLTQYKYFPAGGNSDGQ
jgi:predicted dehydrogenase